MSHQFKILKVEAQIVMWDKDDMRKLGEFLVALSNTQLASLGALGGARIEFSHQDYQARFENGAIVRKQHRMDREVLRYQKCSTCSTRFCSDDIKQKLCEYHLDVAYIA